MTHPEFGKVQVIALYGDGIVMADPVRGVVVGPDGDMLAVTPLMVDAQITCDPDQEMPVCRVYDPVDGVIYEPDLGAWQSGALIIDTADGRPIADPELIDAEYGFIARNATWFERVRFDAMALIQTPRSTFMAILYWAVVWAFVMRILLRWAQSGWRMGPFRIGVLVWTIGHIALFAVGWVLAAFGWMWAPYSIIWAGFVCVIGALLAFAVVYVWRGPAVRNDAAVPRDTSSGK